MQTRIALPSFLLVAGLAIAGCGSSNKTTTTFGCAQLCADINKCPTTTTQIDCVAACAAVATANGNMTSSTCPSASSNFDSLTTCFGAHESEICTVVQTGSSPSCTTESIAYAACALTYCQAHTTDAACVFLHSLSSYFPG